MKNFLQSNALKQLLNDRIFVICLGLITVLGLALRLYPGKDYIIWNNDDYGRDEYTVRKMVEDRDFIKIVGPSAAVYSFRHNEYRIFTGPLYYYFIAPLYALSKGDPNLPVIASILIHFTSLVPLGLLSYKLFKNRAAVLITVFLFAISYEQIEYSRWLLNPVFALPFLSWAYYFLWEVVQNRKKSFWLGMFIGLAIQSEIFLGYWIPAVLLAFIATKQKFKQWILLALGGVVGVFPIIISELKFNFRMTDSIIFDFLLFPHYREGRSLQAILGMWMEHWGLVAKNILFNTDIKTSFLGLVLLILGAIIIAIKERSQRKILFFILFTMLAPAIIFTTNFVNKAYVDLGLGFSFILLATFFLNYLWKWSKTYVFVFLFITLIAQVSLLRYVVESRQPFSGYSFLPTENILYIDKMEIIDSIYQHTKGNPFTISVMDLSYGYPQMWASVFEQYSIRNHVMLPKWYGWYANDTPGDHIFQTTDHPEEIHVVIRPRISPFDPIAQEAFYQKQNEVTQVEEIIEKNNYLIEFRRKKIINEEKEP